MKVLFGLTEYTKSASRGDLPKSNATSSKEDRAVLATALSSPTVPKISESEDKIPVDMAIFHGIDRSNLEKFLSSIRDGLSVRGLSSMETGVTLGETPRGTRFYVSYIWLRGVDGPDALRELHKVSIFREGSQDSYFEAYRTGSGELKLLVFATEAEAVGARTLSGKTSVKFLASPIPWGASTSALLLPVERIVSMRVRELEVGGGVRIGAVDTVLR